MVATARKKTATKTAPKKATTKTTPRTPRPRTPKAEPATETLVVELGHDSTIQKVGEITTLIPDVAVGLITEVNTQLSAALDSYNAERELEILEGVKVAQKRAAATVNGFGVGHTPPSPAPQYRLLATLYDLRTAISQTPVPFPGELQPSQHQMVARINDLINRFSNVQQTGQVTVGYGMAHTGHLVNFQSGGGGHCGGCNNCGG